MPVPVKVSMSAVSVFAPVVGVTATTLGAASAGNPVTATTIAAKEKERIPMRTRLLMLPPARERHRLAFDGAPPLSSVKQLHDDNA